MFNYYYIENDSIRINSTNKNGGIADIIPPEKTLIFLIYVCFYEGLLNTNEEEEELISSDDIRCGLAAYVLNVYIFNSLSGCMMQSTWNSSLKNEYVYENIVLPAITFTKPNREIINNLLPA